MQRAGLRDGWKGSKREIQEGGDIYDCTEAPQSN